MPVTLPGGIALTDFAGIVTLACHDLRTPLATVRGFAKTLERTAALTDAEARYVELIDAASLELTELLDLLGLLARVEGGRQELAPVDTHTGDLARALADQLGTEHVLVEGDGEATQLDAAIVRTALQGYARCALRHGGLDQVELRVHGTRFELRPVDERLAPILLGDELKDLAAGGATRILRGLGGSVEVTGGALVVAPPV
jgi:signal transduction histidine kinase